MAKYAPETLKAFAPSWMFDKGGTRASTLEARIMQEWLSRVTREE